MVVACARVGTDCQIFNITAVIKLLNTNKIINGIHFIVTIHFSIVIFTRQFCTLKGALSTFGVVAGQGGVRILISTLWSVLT
jgi:hypothetical protein